MVVGSLWQSSACKLVGGILAFQYHTKSLLYKR